MTPSHFILTPVGSSGDVHPYIGIGRALRARGHDVTLVTGEPFQRAAERAGLAVLVIHSTQEFNEIARHPDLWDRRKGLQFVLKTVASAMRQHYESIESVFQPGRSVLVGHALAFAARLFEDTHRVPAATIQLAPSIFRSDYRQPAMTPGVDLARAPRWVKRTLWWLVDRVMIDPRVLPELNRFRRELGLGRVSRVFNGWANSPQRIIGVFPDWFGPPQPDWPPQLRLTGFPLYDEAGQHALAPELDAFLAAGDPPILFTPGSANYAASAFFRASVDASVRLGRRALLLTGDATQVPAHLPESIRHESYVPFSQVLHRCAAIVHHGGVGTAAQSLAAGIPQLLMPLGFDQPDNATRLWRLGVARWVMPAKYTAGRVADALGGLLGDPRVGVACQRRAEAMRGSTALADTCALLEDVAAGRADASRQLKLSRYG